MFRKPREAIPSLADVAPQAPSIGRPPTPPDSTRQKPPHALYMAVPTNTHLGRSKTASKTAPRTSSVGKVKSSGNGNILNFFQKTRPAKSVAVVRAEESLFLDDDDFGTGPPIRKVIQTPTPPRDNHTNEDLIEQYDPSIWPEPISRYNEDDGPFKRRKMDGGVRGSPLLSTDAGGRKKPFFARGASPDRSESEIPKICEGGKDAAYNRPDVGSEASPISDEGKIEDHGKKIPPIPSPKQESTSYAEPTDFDGIEDFDDQEFPEEGEEYLERVWMQEQAELEMGIEEDDADGTPDGKMRQEEEEAEITTEVVMHDETAVSCPICSTSLAGVMDQVRFTQDV